MHNSIKLIGILFFVMVFSIAKAQNYKVSISDPIDFSPEQKITAYGTHFIGFEQTDNKRQLGYTFKLNKMRFGIKLYEYDRSMKEIKAFALHDGERSYGPFPPSLKHIYNKLYLVYYQLATDTDEGDIKIMAAEIDTASLNILAPKELLVIEQANTGMFKSINLLSTAMLSIEESPDKSKTGVAWCVGGKNYNYFYALLDADLNPIWKKKGAYTGEPKEFEMSDFCIDNNENAYLGFRYYEDKMYNGHVIIGKKSGNEKQVTLALAEGQPFEVKLAPSPGGEIINIAGTYTNGKGSLPGVFKSSLNTTDFKLSKIQQTLFTDEFLAQLKNSGWADMKGKDRGIDYIHMDIHVLKNGTVDMVGMFRRIQEGIKTNFAVTGDILLVRFNSGNTVNCYRVPKYRVSTGNTIGDSYSVFYGDTTTIVFYNVTFENPN